MSWLVTAVVVTGVVSAEGQRRAGKAQQYELERQAEEEKVAAEGRELQRRQQLNKVLSQSIVGQSMSGIAGEGTPESIALESAKNVSVSEGMESLSDRLRQAQLKRQAKQAKAQGRLAAASTLLSTTTSAAMIGGGGGDK